MADPNATRNALPNFRTARLLGITNLLFSTQILVCGLCMGGYVATLPLWGSAMRQVVQQAEEANEKRKQADLDAIAEAEKAATTEEEKAALADRRKAVESRPDPNAAMMMMDFTKMGFDDPTVLAWSWAEVASGLVLNVMLLASGIGLMNWKRWGWSLGVWTAVLKILRLVALYALFIVVVVPPMSKAMGDMVGEMMAQQQAAAGGGGGAGAPSAELFTRVYTVSYSAMGVGMILGGVIYPVILLWLLSKPGVKVACSGLYVPPKEPRQP